MIEEIYEHQLIQAIQPLRHHALATAIYHLFNECIYDKLTESAMPVRALAEEMNLDEGKLLGLLRYLANEGIIGVGDEKKIQLSQNGLCLNKFCIWYIFLLKGMAPHYL